MNFMLKKSLKIFWHLWFPHIVWQPWFVVRHEHRSSAAWFPHLLLPAAQHVWTEVWARFSRSPEQGEPWALVLLQGWDGSLEGIRWRCLTNLAPNSGSGVGLQGPQRRGLVSPCVRPLRLTLPAGLGNITGFLGDYSWRSMAEVLTWKVSFLRGVLT